MHKIFYFFLLFCSLNKKKMTVFTNGPAFPLPGLVEKQQDIVVEQRSPVKKVVPVTVKQPDGRGQQPVKRVDSNWSFLTVFITLFNAFMAFIPRLAVASRRIRKNFLLLLKDFSRCVRRGSLNQSPNTFNFFLLACWLVSLNFTTVSGFNTMYNISVFVADVAIFYWIYSNWNTYKPAPKVKPAVEPESSNAPLLAVGVLIVVAGVDVAGVDVAGSVFASKKTTEKDEKNN
jgi:hypothetical protein